MTFLELCQKAALESGVIDGTQPTTVIGQTGLLAKLVSWTADAVEWVEQEENGWLWMRKPWSGSLTASSRTYAAASFTSPGNAIGPATDFGSWITDDVRRKIYPVTLYLTATGVSDEQRLKQIPYEQWQRDFDTGTQTTERPWRYTISPRNEIIFAQSPDAAYTAKGMYRRCSLRPTINTSTPAWPVQYHVVAAWEAGRRLALFDEAYDNARRCEMERDTLMQKLRADQLPPMRFSGGPLA